MKKNNLFKLIFALAFIFILILLVNKFDIFNKENIRFILNEGEEREYIFIPVATILLIFFVPLSWIILAGGILFGFKGYINIMISAIIASIISFLVSRVFRDGITNFIYKFNRKRKRPLDLRSISMQIENYGKGYIYFLRTVPMIPYTLINYVSGITSISFVDYLWGTVVGLVISESLNILLIKSIYNIRESFFRFVLILAIKLIYTGFVMFYQREKRKFR